MATKLHRHVVRETTARDNRTGKPLMVELVEGGRLIRLWPKGCRRRYTVTVDQVYVQGWKNQAAQERAERATRRARKRTASV